MPTEEELKNMSPEEIAKLQQENCIFCKIVKGEIPSKIIYKDKICTAFLDINPASFGHMLLVTNNHYQLLPQVSDNELEHLASVAKNLSHSALKGLKSKGVTGTNILIANGAIAGQKAPHVIIHIIPRKDEDNLSKKIILQKHSISKNEQVTIANALIDRVNTVFQKNIQKIGEQQPGQRPSETKSESIGKSSVEKKPSESEQKQKTEEQPKKEETIKENADLDRISKLFGA
jgi:histidine triad (HIT) family protein